MAELQAPDAGAAGHPPVNAATLVYVLFAIAVIGALAAHGLIVFAPLVGLAGIVGVIIAYVKRGDAHGTWVASHFTWLIRTFWWSWLWGGLVLAAMLWVIVPNAMQVAELTRTGNVFAVPWSILAAGAGGGIGLAIVWFWTAYRLTRGILRLSDGRSVP